MGNCLPRFSAWRATRHKARTSSTASSTTSQLPPSVSASSHKANAKKHAPITDPNFDLLSPDPPRPAPHSAYGLTFTATFGATTTPTDPPPTTSPPAKGQQRRKHRKALTSSLPSKRPSTPNPFDGLSQPPLTIAVHPGDPFRGLPGADGPLSVSHVSKNGVSFFPHYSINYEGKEADDEGEESVGGGEGEEEKSRLSSTEMDDDISVRYTTPTMASNHIVRPLPSPSSLSVPQPSIGSGIGSTEHSIVHSAVAPSAYRQKSLTSTSGFQFPPVFSPPSAKTRGEGDIYSDSETASTSPMSAHPQPPLSAASPPSATSPLAHPPQQPPPFRPHEPSPPASHARAASHAPTTNIQSPPPPTSNHLALNTNAVALASQLFDDSDLFPASSPPAPSATSDRYAAPQKPRSPRAALQSRGPQVARGSFGPASAANSLSPHSAVGAGESIGPALPLHRLSSQPQASEPLHTAGGGGAGHAASHSLSLSRLVPAAPRSPNTGARGSQVRRREGDEDEGDGVEGKEDEDSGTTSRDSRSREENSRVRGVGAVRT